jgi:hypothetical protein
MRICARCNHLPIPARIFAQQRYGTRFIVQCMHVISDTWFAAERYLRHISNYLDSGRICTSSHRLVDSACMNERVFVRSSALPLLCSSALSVSDPAYLLHPMLAPQTHFTSTQLLSSTKRCPHLTKDIGIFRIFYPVMSCMCSPMRRRFLTEKEKDTLSPLPFSR